MGKELNIDSLLLTEADLAYYFPKVFDGSLDVSDYGKKKRHYLAVAKAQVDKIKEAIDGRETYTN